MMTLCAKLKSFASGCLLFFGGVLRKLPLTFDNLPEALSAPGSYPLAMLKVSSIRLAAAAIGFGALFSGCATTSPIKTTLAPLPETVTSFGAATSGDYLYAFGGHKGERHDYSVEKVSGSFQRLKLSDGPRVGIASVRHARPGPAIGRA